MLVSIGLNYKKASVGVREKMAIGAARHAEVLARFYALEGVRECVLLSTCNRFELYLRLGSLDAMDLVRNAVKHDFNISGRDMAEYFYAYECEKAARHLFEVVSSLDSMIIGESQILGQIKDAYALAVANKTTAVVLNKLFHHAIRVGKLVRTDTSIGRNAVSVSSVAVDLAKKALGDLERMSVLLIGAGEMAELAVTCLMANGVKNVAVVSRTLSRAIALAGKYGADPAEMRDMYEKMALADIVISSTSAPHYVVEPRRVAEAMLKRPEKPLVLIDIAVPRDIDPGVSSVENVHLYNIDDLRQVIDGNMLLRSSEVKKTRKIISGELDLFIQWLSKQSVMPFVSRFRKHVEEIIKSEIDKFSKRMPANDIMQKSIKAFTEAVINRITSTPIIKIQKCGSKCHVESCIRNVGCLFNLDGDFDEETAEPVRTHREETAEPVRKAEPPS